MGNSNRISPDAFDSDLTEALRISALESVDGGVATRARDVSDLESELESGPKLIHGHDVEYQIRSNQHRPISPGDFSDDEEIVLPRSDAAHSTFPPSPTNGGKAGGA